MNTFIFDDIKDVNIAKLGEYWYCIDVEIGEVKFKSKYSFNCIRYNRYFQFNFGNIIYVTDISGNIILKSSEKTIKTDLKQLPNYYYEEEEIFDFDTKNFDFVRYDFTYNDIKYYRVKKDGKYAIMDEFLNIVIDFDYDPLRIIRSYKRALKPYFMVENPNINLYGVIDIDKNIIIPYKYKTLSDTYLYERKILLCARDKKTNKCGIIDIKENAVIPFIYDDIYDWNIDTDNKTIMVEKDNKCGIINLKNEIVFPFEFKYILGFIGEYSLAQNEKSKWGLINRRGDIIGLNLNVNEFNFEVN